MNAHRYTMPVISRRTFAILAVVSSLCACETLQTFAMTFKELANSRFEQVSRHYYDKINGIRAQFDVYHKHKIVGSIKLSWNLTDSLFRAERRQADNGHIAGWVLGKQHEWQIVSSLDPQEQKRGSLQVSMLRPGLGIPLELNLQRYEVNFIRSSWTPMIWRDLALDKGLSEVHVKITEQPIPGTAQIKRIYDFTNGPHAAGRMIYVLDKTDGIRIYHNTLTQTLYGVKRKVFRGDYSDFIKSNGLWVPRDISEIKWDRDGKVKSSTQLRFTVIELNPIFHKDEFHYTPPKGSMVIDSGPDYVSRR